MSIVVQPENYRHITRHFSGVSEGAREKLIALGISNDEIEIALKALGGKFYEKVSDPFVLVSALRSVIEVDVCQWVVVETLGLERCDLIFSGSVIKDAFGMTANEMIGYHCVVEIVPGMEIHQEERGLLEEDRVIVNVVTNYSPIPTDIFSVVLVRKDGIISLATTYPCGKETGISPELPNAHTQSLEEFKKNTEWWSHYAFIK